MKDIQRESNYVILKLNRAIISLWFS